METAVTFKILLTLTIAIGISLLWKIFLIIIAKKMEININEKQISFMAKGQNIKILPYVYISKITNRYQLVGIGNLPTTGSDFVTVNILNPAKSVQSKAELEECIEAFFRSASYKLFNQKLLLFTVATVNGAELFKKSIGDNKWKESLDKCLRKSGSIKRKYI
jgi:hypothetical protein